MFRLLMLVAFETAIGIAAAGVLLAVAIPMMVRRHLIMPGDVAGSVLISVVLIGAIALMLFRPGSAINRFVSR